MKTLSTITNDKPTKLFRNQKAWATWLAKNHEKSTGIWLRFAKKGAGLTSVTYDEALDVALCYGWIDGQAKSESEQSYLQKFTPRGRRSIWSKRNVGKAETLIENETMQAAGLSEIERAKADGRWDAAYDSPKNASVPDDLRTALNKNKRAMSFFETLTGRNKYAILFRIQTAKKPETRARRIREFVEMLEHGETLYS
ncbi:MAG: YdeI family protein [Pyrinomonadaceae bacterium]